MSTSRTREKADGELFKSTGIDDNATSTKVTVSNTGVEVTGDITLTSAGSIKTQGTDMLLGTADTGIRFYDQTSSIYPVNVDSSSDRDNAVDLGHSSVRFKDLYLSGGVYLGGTAAANKLDDYEEGTFTPSINQGTTGFTYTHQQGTYVKIGRLVFISFRLDLTGGSVDGNQLRLAGLPFGPDNAGAEQSGITWAYTKMGLIGGALPTAFVVAGGLIYFYKGGSGSAYTGTNLSVANANIRGSMVYRTAE